MGASLFTLNPVAGVLRLNLLLLLPNENRTSQPVAKSLAECIITR
jgi:hypothetical protein